MNYNALICDSAPYVKLMLVHWTSLLIVFPRSRSKVTPVAYRHCKLLSYTI